MMRRTAQLACLLAAPIMAMAMAAPAAAAIKITEFMYQGAASGSREFLEITNLGAIAVDVSNWSYNDDNPNNPVNFGSAFGSLAAGESAILTEMTADAFRSYWGLSASVKVFSIGGNSNLGGEDTINIYSSTVQSAATLVDSVAYSGTTRGVSRNLVVGGTSFVDAAMGDLFGSVYAPSTPADLGNPGRYPAANAGVPEPATWAMLIAGFGLAGAGFRRRRAAVLA